MTTPHSTDSSPPPASRLSWGLDRLLGLAFCGVVLLNFVSAATRYLGGGAILGADEVQVYAVVWLVFIGAAIAAWRGTHLRMDVFSSRLHGRAARLRDLLEGLLALAACGAMAWVSWRFVRQIHEMAQRSDGAGIPMWIPHAAVFVGFALITLAAAYTLVKSLRAMLR
ncbi:TRAP transporter small permease [Aquabacterium sp.]|uniref:TRAP transporter small permease n=1 Tax=Aquabacterium sp. TaxID=1872578 RepID=UPI002C7BB5B9|nr:TRAP transporter small permease [Aquabacterium sp.]HSW05900.1 TRAP transporter small permease [Aquabacterium sp.]